jgi:DNA-binding transcriptional ArsR family regulator
MDGETEETQAASETPTEPKEEPKVATKTKKAASPKKPAAVKSKAKTTPSANGNYRKAANLIKMASDATRLQIIDSLGKNEEMHVGALCETVGQSQPAVSHHLALLRHSGVIEPRRSGKNNHYSLTENGQALHSAVADLI